MPTDPTAPRPVVAALSDEEMQVRLDVDKRLARIGLRFDTREDYDTARQLLTEPYGELRAARQATREAERRFAWAEEQGALLWAGLEQSTPCTHIQTIVAVALAQIERLRAQLAEAQGRSIERATIAQRAIDTARAERDRARAALQRACDTAKAERATSRHWEEDAVAYRAYAKSLEEQLAARTAAVESVRSKLIDAAERLDALLEKVPTEELTQLAHFAREDVEDIGRLLGVTDPALAALAGTGVTSPGPSAPPSRSGPETD